MPRKRPETLGQRLRRLREAAGLSQRQLAFEGCTPAYISRIEADDRRPSIYTLRGLAGRLGCSVEYLETGKPSSSVEVEGVHYVVPGPVADLVADLLGAVEALRLADEARREGARRPAAA